VLEAPVGYAIWSLWWPIAISNELGMVAVGLWFVWLGRLVGDAGLVVESTFGPFALLILWLFGSASVGASVLVSRSIGANDGRGLSVTAAAGTLTLAMWAVLAVVVLPISPWLAGVLSGDLPVQSSMLSFLLGWMLVALPSTSIVGVLLEVANATGATKFNLVRVVVDFAFRAALVPVLIGLAGFGIAGAPIADGIGALGLIVVVWIALVRRRTTLGLGKLGPGAWRVRWTTWKEILAIGMPPQLGRISMFAAELVLVRLVMLDGKTSVAGYGIAATLLMIGGTATFALSQAGATLIGQALGAGLAERARGAIRTTLFAGTLIIALFIGATVFDRPLIELFSPDGAIVDAAVRALSIMRWGLLGVATWQILLAAFAAYTRTMKASIVVILGEALGLAVACLLPGSHLDSVCISFIAASIFKAVLLLALVATGELGGGESPVLGATPGES
jgi:Na+-driven multidrug efflux pump